MEGFFEEFVGVLTGSPDPAFERRKWTNVDEMSIKEHSGRDVLCVVSGMRPVKGVSEDGKADMSKLNPELVFSSASGFYPVECDPSFLSLDADFTG